MFGLADDIRPALRQARDARSPMVLATLTAVDGGGPRPVGAQMAFAENIVAGYFSGGCIEADVAGHAQACLDDGQPRTLVYGQGSPWPDIRLLCGARLEIVLERIAPDDRQLAEILAAEAERRPAVWRGEVVRAYEPAPRLLVVGADPPALAIAALGAQSGYETILVRPKGPEAGPPLLGVGYRREISALPLDAWTAAAAASHDIEVDQQALVQALGSPAFYVGLLGARTRLPERLARLRAAGVSEGSLARLHAPIGLDLGGKAPWEVAVAVIGEITAVRYARTSGQTSTTSPATAAGAPADLFNRASAAANTVTSDES
jgi:xanthine dehydrogenase accessory factor